MRRAHHNSARNGHCGTHVVERLPERLVGGSWGQVDCAGRPFHIQGCGTVTCRRSAGARGRMLSTWRPLGCQLCPGTARTGPCPMTGAAGQPRGRLPAGGEHRLHAHAASLMASTSSAQHCRLCALGRGTPQRTAESGDHAGLCSDPRRPRGTESEALGTARSAAYCLARSSAKTLDGSISCRSTHTSSRGSSSLTNSRGADDVASDADSQLSRPSVRSHLKNSEEEKWATSAQLKIQENKESESMSTDRGKFKSGANSNAIGSPAPTIRGLYSDDSRPLFR